MPTTHRLLEPHNPIAARRGGWRVERTPEDKRDRAPAVLYRVKGMDYKAAPKSRWSLSEQFALDNKMWIAELIEEDPEAFSAPMKQRPGALRLASLARIGLVALVEAWEDLGSPCDQAVIASIWGDQDRRLVVAGTCVAQRTRDNVVRSAGGVQTVGVAAAELEREMEIGLTDYVRDTNLVPLLVGSGEARDVEAASDYAEVLRRDGVGERKILDRLNLLGYRNVHGRVVWNTHNVPTRGGRA